MKGFIVLNDNKIAPNLSSVVNMTAESIEAEEILKKLNHSHSNVDWAIKNLSDVIKNSDDYKGTNLLAFTVYSKPYKNIVQDAYPSAEIVLQNITIQSGEENNSTSKFENYSLTTILLTIIIQLFVILFK